MWGELPDRPLKAKLDPSTSILEAFRKEIHIMAKIYGYARCSTNDTKQDVERQRRELRNMGAEEIYLEYESGTKINRPELNKVLSHIAAGDTLITLEVSRLTRSLRQLCDIIELAKERKIKLIIGTLVIDCTGSINPMTEAMLQIMGVFAELERKMTIERIYSGLAHAKAKGVRLGRPKLAAKDIPKKVIDKFKLYQSGELSKTEYARLCEISRPTLYKYIALMTDG
ncbi:MAG: recombinase family protein [Oscillospiraceae bacterium]|nr:recombinase family protein [Oscillospiraceae bacterium]